MADRHTKHIRLYTMATCPVGTLTLRAEAGCSVSLTKAGLSGLLLHAGGDLQRATYTHIYLLESGRKYTLFNGVP